MGLEYTQGHDRIAHPVLKQRMIDDTHTPVSAMSAHIFHTSPDQQKPPIAHTQLFHSCSQSCWESRGGAGLAYLILRKLGKDLVGCSDDFIKI